ncbi:MAG TPA: fluoride efflux transporter CrcB [Croceicoccus sp.]|nr:fluoride efflux transporter CrcB [Croceicoccus sp.]
MIQPSSMNASLLVALGGGAGAVLRYHLGRAVGSAYPAAAMAFPWATLACNVLGSMAMGLLAGWLARHGADRGIGAEGWRLLLGVGLLGGFTTFSAFSLELVNLWHRGAPGMAAAYALVSVIAGVAGLMLGLAVMRTTA